MNQVQFDEAVTLHAGTIYKVKEVGTARAKALTFAKHTTLTGLDGYDFQVREFQTTGGYSLYLTVGDIHSIEVYVPREKKKKVSKVCTRCNGAGRFEHVAHVDNGICFKCNGTGRI